MVGRRGDQGDPWGGVPAPGDPGVDLPGGQVPPLPGLGPLAHLDPKLSAAAFRSSPLHSAAVFKNINQCSGKPLDALCAI